MLEAPDRDPLTLHAHEPASDRAASPSITSTWVRSSSSRTFTLVRWCDTSDLHGAHLRRADMLDACT